MNLTIKSLYPLILSFILVTDVIAQRGNLNNKAALSPDFSYLADFVSNINGGVNTGSRYLGLVNIGVNFNTTNAGLWKGGEFYINVANTHGGEPSAELIGDFQGVSNIEAGNLTYFNELWFKQSLNNFLLIIGLMDLNADYAACALGGIFLNSSFGIHSTIAENVPAPIFPLTRLGLSLQWDINSKSALKFAYYDGLRSDYENNRYNLNWDFKTNEGSLFVSEFQYTGSFLKNKTGKYTIGFYDHNHQIIETVNETTRYKVENNVGLYLLAEQMIIKNRVREGGLGFFSQLGLSSKNQNNLYCYIGFGLNYSGFSENRPDDKLGVAFAHARFKTNIRGSETAIEFNYKAVLGKHFYIQPDIQYIINPSGKELPLNNALVGIVRFGVNL